MRRRTRRVCLRCERERSMKGRGLCDSCWGVCARNGTLHDWPLLMDSADTDPYCRCPEGTPVVRLFAGALECGECHHKVFGKDEPIPESVLG